MWKLVLYRGAYSAYTIVNGQSIRRSSGSSNPEIAKQWFEDFLHLQKVAPESVAEIYEAYKEEVSEAEKRKMGFMAKNLLPFFGPLRPDQLSREKAKSYSQFRSEQKASNNTIIRELGSLRAAVRRFDKSYPQSWFMPAKPPPKDRKLSRLEFIAILDACHSDHIRLFLILALATGARTTAILELQWSQVDFVREMVNLGEGTANKRRSQVPLNQTALKALVLASENSSSDYVIEYNAQPLLSIRKGFDNARDKAGLGKDVTPHVIRHTAAVWMAEAGISMDEIAQYLGHSSTEITYRVYARYSPDYLRKASDVLQ